jgi:hypothetical protein
MEERLDEVSTKKQSKIRKNTCRAGWQADYSGRVAAFKEFGSTWTPV